MTSTAHAVRMRFHVDGWDPTYGSSVENAENTIGDSTAKVIPDLELAPADWKPISTSHVPDPGAVLFVDGVRRVEARIWPPTVARTC